MHLSCTQFRSSLQSGREGGRAAAASIWGSGLTFKSKRREKEEESEQEGLKRCNIGSDCRSVTRSWVNMYILISVLEKSDQKPVIQLTEKKITVFYLKGFELCDLRGACTRKN